MFVYLFHLFVQFNLAKEREELPSIKYIKRRCMEQLDQMRPDHMRRLNPTPYKVFFFLCTGLDYRFLDIFEILPLKSIST